MTLQDFSISGITLHFVLLSGVYGGGMEQGHNSDSSALRSRLLFLVQSLDLGTPIAFRAIIIPTEETASSRAQNFLCVVRCVSLVVQGNKSGKWYKIIIVEKQWKMGEYFIICIFAEAKPSHSVICSVCGLKSCGELNSRRNQIRSNKGDSSGSFRVSLKEEKERKQRVA